MSSANAPSLTTSTSTATTTATSSTTQDVEYKFQGAASSGIHQVVYGEGTSKGIDVLAGMYESRDEAQIVKAGINMRSDPVIHKYRDALGPNVPMVFIQTAGLGHAFVPYFSAVDKMILPLIAWTKLLTVLAPTSEGWIKMMKNLDRHIQSSKRGGPCYNITLQRTVSMYGKETKAVAIQLVHQVVPNYLSLYLKVSKKVFIANPQEETQFRCHIGFLKDSCLDSEWMELPWMPSTITKLMDGCMDMMTLFSTPTRRLERKPISVQNAQAAITTAKPAIQIAKPAIQTVEQLVEQLVSPTVEPTVESIVEPIVKPTAVPNGESPLTNIINEVFGYTTEQWDSAQNVRNLFGEDNVNNVNNNTNNNVNNNNNIEDVNILPLSPYPTTLSASVLQDIMLPNLSTAATTTLATPKTATSLSRTTTASSNNKRSYDDKRKENRDDRRKKDKDDSKKLKHGEKSSSNSSSKFKEPYPPMARISGKSRY